MDTFPTPYTSPSLNTYSSNTFADIADRVIHQLRTENDLNNNINHDVTTPTHNQDAFEFPVISSDSISRQISTESQIRPQFPLFDTTLLSAVDLNNNKGIDSLKTDSDLNNNKGIDSLKTDSPTARRSSLMNLLTEYRDTDSTTSSSSSTSSLEVDELDGVTPGTYCVWKPKAEPPPRGKHKKSNSISSGSTSNRWNVRDLLKRSYSDVDGGKNSPVLVFIPPVSPNKVEKGAKIGSGKTEKKNPIPIPVYGLKSGNVRLQPYMPYREDQLAAFANFAGGKKNMHR